MLTFRLATAICVIGAAIGFVLPLGAGVRTVPGADAVLEGPARVVDGDTLVVAGERVRLHGIDTPEAGQTCWTRNAEWRCGDWATQEMAAMVAGREVRCTAVDGRDVYGRIVARCEIGAQDIGQSMVRKGAAYAYRKYSDIYVGEERAAQAAGLGLHATRQLRPDQFRAHSRAGQTAEVSQAAQRRGDGCEIKGNISGKGARVYHVPGQRNYADTVITPRKGERYFCSEVEARAAGWRAAKR